MFGTMRPFVGATIATLLVLMAATTVWAQSPAPWPAAASPSEAPLQQDLAALYHQHILAINRGDLAAVMVDYTPDATFISPNPTGPCNPAAPCMGKEAIQQLFQGLFAAHLQAGIINLQVTGNVLTGRLNILTDGIRAAGYGVARIKVTVTYAGDKIARDVVEYDVSDPATANYVNFVRLSGILRAHYDAMNRGDADAVVAGFTDDAVLVRGGRCPDILPCVGKEAILRGVLLERENQVRFTIVSLSVSGDTVTARVESRGIGPSSAGVERVVQKHTVTFVGDKIARFTAELDVSDPLTAAFTNFVRVNRPPILRGEARRRGDIAGAMATFTDDAVVEGWGLCTPRPCVGKAAIQREIERQAADGEDFRVVTGTARVSGNTRTARVEIRSDSIRAAGVERVIVLATEEVPVDKTSHVRFELDTTDAQTAAYLAARPRALPRTGDSALPLAGLLAAIAGIAALGLGQRLRHNIGPQT